MPENLAVHPMRGTDVPGDRREMMNVCKKRVVSVVQDGESFDSVFSEFRFAEDYAKKCPGNECQSVIKVELQEGFCDEMPPSHEMHLQSNISTRLNSDEQEALDLMFKTLFL